MAAPLPLGVQAHAQVDDGGQQVVEIEAEDAVELQPLLDALDQGRRHRFSGDVVLREAREHVAGDQPALVENRRRTRRIPGNAQWPSEA